MENREKNRCPKCKKEVILDAGIWYCSCNWWGDKLEDDLTTITLSDELEKLKKENNEKDKKIEMLETKYLSDDWAMKYYALNAKINEVEELIRVQNMEYLKNSAEYLARIKDLKDSNIRLSERGLNDMRVISNLEDRIKELTHSDKYKGSDKNEEK